MLQSENPQINILRQPKYPLINPDYNFDSTILRSNLDEARINHSSNIYTETKSVLNQKLVRMSMQECFGIEGPLTQKSLQVRQESLLGERQRKSLSIQKKYLVLKRLKSSESIQYKKYRESSKIKSSIDKNCFYSQKDNDQIKLFQSDNLRVSLSSSKPSGLLTLKTKSTTHISLTNQQQYTTINHPKLKKNQESAVFQKNTAFNIFQNKTVNRNDSCHQVSSPNLIQNKAFSFKGTDFIMKKINSPYAYVNKNNIQKATYLKTVESSLTEDNIDKQKLKDLSNQTTLSKLCKKKSQTKHHYIGSETTMSIKNSNRRESFQAVNLNFLKKSPEIKTYRQKQHFLSNIKNVITPQYKTKVNIEFPSTKSLGKKILEIGVKPNLTKILWDKHNNNKYNQKLSFTNLDLYKQPNSILYDVDKKRQFKDQLPKQICNFSSHNSNTKPNSKLLHGYKSYYLKQVVQRKGYIPETDRFIVLKKIKPYVNVVLHTKTGFIFVLKQVKTNQSNYERTINEYKILSYCNHPNILKCFGLFQDITYSINATIKNKQQSKKMSISLYLLLQYMDCTIDEEKNNLLFQNKTNLTYQQKQKKIALFRQYSNELLSGIQYLHSKNIIHRDLKPQNILLFHHTCKICDFGHSSFKQDNKKIGTVDYVAPQVLNNMPYGNLVDIWSLGCLFYQMWSGDTPFYDSNVIETYRKIIECQYDIELIENLQLRHIIERMLNIDDKLRPKAKDLLQYDFMVKKDELWKNLEQC